jgi:hypothetical protein
MAAHSLANGIGNLVGAIFGLFVAIILVWALYPVLAQLGSGYGLLFVLAAGVMIVSDLIGILKGR